MHIISSDIIIANYFNNHTEIDSITSQEIFKKTQELHIVLKNKGISSYIDYTRDSIINMLNINPDLFERDSDSGVIYLKDRKKLQEEVFFYFNAKLPHEIKETCLEAMKTF